jgi:hypothetical protein
VAAYSGSSVYLRASVTEKGASDEYQFFYKANSADAWTQLGSVNFVPVNPVQGNALTGIFYKTAAARPGVSVSELSTSGGSSANIPNIDSTALPVVDTSAPVTPNLTLATGVASGATLAEATTALLTLTAESGAGTVVTFSRTGGGTVSKTYTGNGSTPVAVTLTSAELTTLGDGSISVSAVATDAAGNEATSTELSVTIDTVIQCWMINGVPIPE